MTDNLVPTLNREARSATTRESETRRKPWAPPSRLDAPPPLEGTRHRWIRAEIAGQEDRVNVAGGGGGGLTSLSHLLKTADMLVLSAWEVFS